MATLRFLPHRTADACSVYLDDDVVFSRRGGYFNDRKTIATGETLQD